MHATNWCLLNIFSCKTCWSTKLVKASFQSIIADCFQIVHPIQHRLHWRKSTLYAAVVLPWMSCFLITLPFLIPTVGIDGGYCRTMTYWPSPTYAVAYSIFSFCVYFVFPYITFIFCYSRIIWIVRRSSAKTGQINRRTVNQLGATKDQSIMNSKQVTLTLRGMENCLLEENCRKFNF